MARIYKATDPQRPDTKRERQDAEVARLREQDKRASVSLRARKRAGRRGLHKVDVNANGSLPGDRTGNTPSLRKDAKFRNKLELSDHTYLLIPNGICACVNKDGQTDVAFTLAVLQHYRHIMASRKTPPDMQKDV